MTQAIAHRQLIKEFMALGPYLRAEQSEPGRYFFDCLASCLNFIAAPDRREFWGWWLVLERCEGGFVLQSEQGLFSRDGLWLSRQPTGAAEPQVAQTHASFMQALQALLEGWQLQLYAPDVTEDSATSAA